MTASRLAAALLALALAGCASTPSTRLPDTVPGGPADGAFVVGDDTTRLTQAYATELQPARRKPREIRIVLASQALPREVAGDFSSIDSSPWIRAVTITVDLTGKLRRVRFHHSDLPREIDVTGDGAKLELSGLPDGPLRGRFSFDDANAYSWTATATFESRLDRAPPPAEVVTPADASPAEKARIELEAERIAVTAESFLDKCLAGDPGIVKLLLAAGIPISTRDGRGSALQSALISKSEEVVAILLEAGADPNEVVDDFGTTILLRAVDTGQAGIVKRLLQARANVNAANTYRMSPLMSAATIGDFEMVEALVAAGAKVTARTPTGGSALMFAVGAAHVEVVRRLVAAGADVARDRETLMAMIKDKKDPAVRKALEKALGK